MKNMKKSKALRLPGCTFNMKRFKADCLVTRAWVSEVGLTYHV